MLKDKTHFELAPAELAVPLKAAHAGRTYRLVHKLRPPAHGDWVAYEAALHLSVEELNSTGRDSEPRYRFDGRNSEAAQLLWDRLAVAVEGYGLPVPSTCSGAEDRCLGDSSPTKADDNPASRLPIAMAEPQAGIIAATGSGEEAHSDSSPDAQWRSLVPLAHKEAAIRSLTLVAPAELSDAQPGELLPLAAERTPVILEAARAGEATLGLVHWFRLPSLEDERRYRRLMAETVLVGGSRGSRALIPARLPPLCRLYDSLVISTERYTLDSSSDISMEQLTRHMDSWHKRSAVQALFGDATETNVTDAVTADDDPNPPVVGPIEVTA